MSIYHCSIKIISRSGGRSAVASAAYRSGERLYNDETGITHDFTKKGGVVMNEILLPENAPERFSDREILWNEVQKIEKRSDAQFAREVEVALPTEMNRDEQIACVRAYVQENFVSKGMLADWALHDKGDGNPHAHIMLTMRGIDEHEQWLQKQKTVFANSRDEHGRAIYDPSLPSYDSKDREHTSQYRIPALDKDGKQKTRERKGKGTEYLWEKISIPANDWNEHSIAETWRASWAEHCNRYLDQEHRIDHRSYARQGLDQEPTIHEGVTARQMEKEGKTADRCEINREIRERNSIRQQLKELAAELTKVITEKARALYERIKEFRGNPRDAERTGTDAGYPGKTAGRDRGAADGESELERTAGRIHELKRAADRTGEEIDRTESEIAETDQRIEELRQLAAGKEAERNERLRRLKDRRASHNAGRSSGRDRESAGSDIRSTADDISAFLRELRAEERASEEKRNDSFSERADREAERERSRAEAERAAREAEQRAAVERAEVKRRGRSHGIDR
jgi:ATP-dependent exoDNAse (exonuclease V) alpha subunit